MTITRWIPVLAAAAVATAIAVIPADAAPSGTLTFTLKESKRDTKQIDIAPHGESIGDRIMLSSTARKDGKVAGRTEAECVLQDRTYEGFACVGNLLLKDGTITFQGASVNKAIPGLGKLSSGDGDVYAITGGTGAYVGASGTVRLHGPENAEIATVTFAT